LNCSREYIRTTLEEDYSRYFRTLSGKDFREFLDKEADLESKFWPEELTEYCTVKEIDTESSCFPDSFSPWTSYIFYRYQEELRGDLVGITKIGEGWLVNNNGVSCYFKVV